MSADPKEKRLACDPELQTAQEQERRSCTSRPTEKVGPCEPKRTVRCEHEDRELYRNRFPAET